MNKILLSISILLLAQFSFAGHHEAGEKPSKTIIGYDTTEGTKILSMLAICPRLTYGLIMFKPTMIVTLKPLAAHAQVKSAA